MTFAPSWLVPPLLSACLLWAAPPSLAAAAATDCNALLESTTPRVVASGFQYTEGPAWDDRAGRFVFSDIPADTVYELRPDGQVTARLKPSGYANGNAFGADGSLWSARHDRKVAHTDPHGTTRIAVEGYDGKPLNSPNDLVVASDGAVWFTDPPFGIQGFGPQKAAEEQPVRGVYRLQEGRLTLMDGSRKLPNGLAFGPNGALFVADTADGTVYRHGRQPDGSLAPPQSFARIEPPPGHDPMVDGIRVDREGRLWMTGPGSVGVFSAQGSHLCTLPVAGGHVSNLAFGGRDGRDVLLTASERVLALRARQALR